MNRDRVNDLLTYVACKIRMIRQLHELTGLPIYSGMPFGHIGKKYSFPLGVTCQMSPDVNGGYQLVFTDYPTIKADAIQVEGLWQTA